MPLTILVDTNLFVSFLLTPEGRRTTITRVLEFIIESGSTWIVPAEQLAEIDNQRRKPSLLARVPDFRWNDFIAFLGRRAMILPMQTAPFPSVVRDDKDDYLIAIAIWEEVDILISGDKDLLVLSDVLERPRILSPAAFLAEFGPD